MKSKLLSPLYGVYFLLLVSGITDYFSGRTAALALLQIGALFFMAGAIGEIWKAKADILARLDKTTGDRSSTRT